MTATRVLIVDDTEDIHIVMRAAIEALVVVDEPSDVSGVAIDSAFQGEEACAMVQVATQSGAPYDLVFMDMRMPPGWDGLITSKKILEISPRTEVVIMTAFSDHSRDQINATLAVQPPPQFLSKPFALREIGAVIRDFSERMRQRVVLQP